MSGSLTSDVDLTSPSLDRRSMRHGMWAIIGKLANAGGAVLATLVLARVLKPDDFGKFIVIRTGLGAMSILAAFGLGTAALRGLGRCGNNLELKQSTVRATIRAAIVPHVLAGVTAGACCWLYSERLLETRISLWGAFVVAVATILLGSIQICSDMARGLDDLATANILGGNHGSPILNVLLIPIVLAAALVTTLSWEGATCLYAATIAITFAVGGASFLRHSQRLGLRIAFSPDDNAFSPKPVHTMIGGGSGMARPEPSAAPGEYSEPVSCIKRDLISIAWPAAIASLLVLLSAQCDVFLAGMFQDTSTTPLYIAARRVVMLLIIPASITYSAASGVISPLYSAGHHLRLEQTLRGNTTLAAIPTCLIAAVMMLFPIQTLRLVLGIGYDQAATLLQVLVAGHLFILLTGNSGILLTLSGRGRMCMWVNLAATIVLATAGPWIASRYGATTLAVQTSLLIALKSIAVTELARITTGINTWVDPRCRVVWTTLAAIKNRTSRAHRSEIPAEVGRQSGSSAHFDRPE